MPRKCVLCGASQSINLSVFAFPKSSHQRGAWVTAIQHIVPGFCDPQAEGQLTGVRRGVCERHFQPQDIKKGKNSSLHRKAVPLVAASLMEGGDSLDIKGIPAPFSDDDKTRGSFLISEEDAFRGVDEDQISVVCKKESTWQVDQTKDPENCMGINMDDFIPDESTFNGSGETVHNHALTISSNEALEKDVCLVCGRVDNNINLICVLQVHELAGNVSVSLLLSKIVGRSKREVLCVSVKICSRCEVLVQEVAQIEEDLKYKKQAIKRMYESTLQEHREKSKARTNVSEVYQDKVHCSRNLAPDSGFEAKNSNFQGERISEEVRKSSRRQASSRKYRCPHCKEVYSSLALWVHHLSKHSDVEDMSNKAKQGTTKIKRKHKVGIHACEECGKTFFCKQTLLAHASAHQKGSECSVCGRYLTTKARLKAHLFKFHGIGEEKNKEVACQDCGRCFGTKAGLRYHRNVVHHIGTEYSCEHCNKTFYYHVPYRSHLLYAHGEKKVICETCGDKFFTISKLNTHINAVHRSAQSWSCDKCDSKFTTYTAYRHHVNVKHLKIQHPCSYCSAQFRKKSSLMVHLWKHSVYICQVCRESFSCNEDLRDHMLVTHGKEVNWKGRRKQNVQLLQKKVVEEEEDELQKNAEEEHIQQNEHVASIVINDLLMTAESYDNSSLQPFSLSSCGKLPEKHSYANDEEMKVKALSMIDTSQDLGAVDSVQFSTHEALEVKPSHDPIEMTPGVSLINVQILGDMEISQSDTLGDLKSSMLADAAEHLAHNDRLDAEDNMAGHLSVETHLSGNLESAGHRLEPADHLEVAGHMKDPTHLASSDHMETADQWSRVNERLVDTVSNPMEMDTELSMSGEGASPHISQDMDQLMAKEGDAGMVEQSLEKQMEKIDEVELEPFPVTLDGKGEVQYRYVMYISAPPGEDSAPG